jgi:uncharacterized membrane protein
MTWVRQYHTRLYVRNSLWIFPAIGIVSGWITIALLARFERSLGWELQLGKDNALAVTSAVASSMFNLIVVACSALLLAIQLASAQLTPRIIVLTYRNSTRKILLAIFAFHFTASVSFLLRIQTSVPLFAGYFVAYGFLVNLVLFLYFIDSFGKSLRPSAALWTVALAGRDVIREVYPRSFDEEHSIPPEQIALLKDEPRITLNSSSDGAFLAFDVRGIVSIAERSNCLIELVPQVGDFVSAGDPLFRIFGGNERPPENRLQESLALGPERTLEQDPMFAFRIIVDVASKALSPAINDPTTAVLAIDQIHHLLRSVGNRDLDEDRALDSSGQLRLVYRTPDWNDFVHLAVTEIRHYGKDSIQVTRRLRAMLENLVELLPSRRAPLLQRELRMLEAATKRSFPDPDDQALAEGSDLQGMGGSQNDSWQSDPEQLAASTSESRVMMGKTQQR